MEQIRWGLQSKVDISVYAKPEYTWQQMREIREKLESKANSLLFLCNFCKFNNFKSLKFQ